MKNLLTIAAFLALGFMAFPSFQEVTVRGAYAATTEEPAEEVIEEERLRNLDDLSDAEKDQIESVLGKRIEDLTPEERERLENMTDAEIAEIAEMEAEDAQAEILDRESEILDAAESADLSDDQRETIADFTRQAEEAGDYATIGQVPPELFEDRDITELAFGSGKKACAMKSSFFFAVAKQMQQGASLSEFTDFEVIQPLFESIITDINTKGMEQASLDNLNEYNACIAANAGDTNPRAAKLDPCAELNTVILDTLDSIERRQSVSTVISRHEGRDIDLSETSYKNLDDPLPLFIGKVYESASTSGMKGATATASSITVGCIN